MWSKSGWGGGFGGVGGVGSVGGIRIVGERFNGKVVGVVGEVGVFLGLVGLVFVEIVGESGLWME